MVAIVVEAVKDLSLSHCNLSGLVGTIDGDSVIGIFPKVE
jgi:hypothetical protein